MSQTTRFLCYFFLLKYSSVLYFTLFPSVALSTLKVKMKLVHNDVKQPETVKLNLEWMNVTLNLDYTYFQWRPDNFQLPISNSAYLVGLKGKWSYSGLMTRLPNSQPNQLITPGRGVQKNISWLIYHCVFRLHLLASQRKGIGMTQDVWPVLGGDDGEVDHLDRRPEKVVVEVDPWEPAKAN